VLHAAIAHAPVAQVAVACAREQAPVQLPQLVSDVSERSQPSASLLLQLPKPALQAAIAQVPVPHAAVAFAREHTTPQVPQFNVVVSAVSQPLASVESQLSKPALQAWMAHEPVEQVAAAFVLVQAVAHAPQCASEVRLCSQPLAEFPSQSPSPGVQSVATQAPVAQVAFLPAKLQVVPQLAQSVRVLSAVSQPFAGLLSQSPKPALQMVSAQVPVAQLAVAFARAQGMPQAPQLDVVVSGASQPLAAFTSQFPKPAVQAPSAHVPEAQLEAAFANTHVVPQTPQFVAVVSDASQPFASARSQLP
jgi:hypothetical protein